MRFPLFLEIAGEPCLVVGAGEVALRKKRILEEFGARVAVSVDFSPEQLNGQMLVVAATDERETNRRVYEAARARKLPVTVIASGRLQKQNLPLLGKDEAWVQGILQSYNCRMQDVYLLTSEPGGKLYFAAMQEDPA